MPDAYKIAQVVPLLKKPSLDKDILKNYRPVSNLPFVSKIIEKAIASRLQLYISQNNLDEPHQSAYRRHHSTETAPVLVQNDILCTLGERKAVLLVLLDLSAAFDTVDHELIIGIIRSIGICGTALDWFISFLSDRRQFVKVGEHESSSEAVPAGVPQGSVLGPILFTIYTSSLGKLLRSLDMSYHLYADDTQIYIAFEPKSYARSIQRLEECIKKVQEWMFVNCLKMNKEKTEFLLITSKHRKSDLCPILHIGDSEIAASETVKNIGVTMDSHASMAQHVNQICKTAHFHLYNIGRIRNYISQDAASLLVHAFITSRLDYGNALLAGLSASLISKLQRIMNIAARIVTRTKKFDHITPVLKHLHWLPVCKRIDFKIALLVFKCIHHLAPFYLCNLISLHRPSRSLRSSNLNLLSVPRFNTNIHRRSFSVYGPILWNSLPDDLRFETEIAIFKPNMTSSQLSSQAEEPPMFLQRPSTARSQDVSHVLARTFRHLFTRDTVAPETVQYLGTSKGGDNPYHERYVERLEQVQVEHQRRLAEAAMLERHIMQAQARAMSADERAVQRMQACNRGFPDLGLPPARAHLRSCLDSELLRNHNLLTPEDYSPKEAPLVPPPSAPPIPPHARETESSCRHHTAEISTGEHTPAFLQQDSSHMPSESESFLTSYDEEDHEDDELNEMDRQRSLLWKSQMNSEVREANRQGLALIEGRVDHLRNPRFMAPSTVPGKSKSLIKSTKRKPKEICIKPKEDPTKEKESVQAFLPSPPAVIFKTYKVNEVYELNLELKNVSGALRPVRAIPPSTKYFSASLGQFPGEHGLVAPGMSCVYKIRFMPDSLIDFDDVLKIQTQASEPLEVPLLGRRPPPILSLPEAIDVGQCLVGGMKSAQFTVKNEGGNGRFCLMPASSWPAANFKAMASVNTVVLPPFEICPPRFELLEGQSIMLEILFHPTNVKSFQEELVIVCDNCHVRHFAISGEGQTARVELVSVEEGVDEPLAGEQMDATADHLIRFSSLNPYTYIQKSITVRNMANVALPFSWLFVKPHIQCGDYDPHAIPTERVQEIDCVFSIEPETGILSPGSTATFSLTYAPPEVSQFHSVLHLVLRNIPTQSSIERQETRDSESGEKVLRSISPPIPAAVASREPLVSDLTGLEISLKGECIPLQVLLQPCIVHIPGQILVETAVKQQFKLLNHSMTSVIFQWENISTGCHVIQVEPPIGELGAMCEMDFEVYVSGSEPGLIDHALLCHIQHLTDPLTLHVQAQIKGPEVTIECADVSFGLVRFGESKTVSLPISNTCRVSTHWGIKESALHSEGLSEFTFEPSGGSLRPLESTEVSITWSPRQPKSVSSIFELDVENGSRSSVFAMGECQKPSVCLISCELTANEVYKDVPSVIRVEMLNQTLLDTVFKWGELEGSDADKVSLRMEPASGHLEGRACFPISLHLMPHTTGALNDLRIPCEIAEMENPLILALRADVKGLSVEYRTRGFTASECRDEELVLDFGDDNPLGSTPKCELFIRNLSAVEATFSLNVERFFVKPPSPPSHDKPAKTQSVTSLRRPGMLTRTPNISDALSKTPKKHETDLKKSMLLEGKGATFVVDPPSGQLQPFGQQRIQLTAFSDIWGQYTDQLICKIGDLEAQRIEMKMGVIGSPLFFQMLASQQNKTPVIRFGTHISEGSTVSRSMRINNPGPIDIRVDWETFVEKKNDAHQMLDLVLSYGKLFPRKDSDGIEILAEDEEAISRQPTRSGVTDDDDASLFAKSRPKVISVTLRVHEGHAGAEQYKVTPPQMVVPARGYNTAHVTFNPVSEGQNVEEENYNGFALGYLSLDSNVSDIDGKVSRKQHYDVEPIRMKMTAAIKPAFLKIECFEDEGMRYRTAVSDLMREGQLMPECIKLCRATLSNPTETQLTFRLVTQGSFYIVEMDPHSHQPVAHMQETDSVSLLPQQSAVVQVGFRISLGLLELAESAIAWDPTKEDVPSSDEATEVRLEIGGQEERKLHLFSQLKIHFNNQHVQRLPLHATLAIPDLSLSNDTVDFGTCLVGQRREVHLVITNRTASDSFWTITQESKTDTVAEGTIEVAPTSGMLGAHVTHIAQNKALLQVFFTAKHAEDYEAVYVLSGMFGEGHKRLKVIGKGSYDGKHEALVNV